MTQEKRTLINPEGIITAVVGAGILAFFGLLWATMDRNAVDIKELRQTINEQAAEIQALQSMLSGEGLVTLKRLHAKREIILGEGEQKLTLRIYDKGLVAHRPNPEGGKDIRIEPTLVSASWPNYD